MLVIGWNESILAIDICLRQLYLPNIARIILAASLCGIIINGSNNRASLQGSDEEILNSEPIIKGTRTPVRAIVE
jgi:hypothetical protein